LHTGADSIIKDVGTGSLYLGSDGAGVNIYNPSTIEFMAKFNVNSDVKLYYDNAQKLATTATGIDVTGTATMDGLTVDGTSLFSKDGGAAQTTAVLIRNTTASDQTSAMTADLDFSLWDDNTRLSTPQARIGVYGDSTSDQNYEAGGQLAFYTNIRNYTSPSLTKRMLIDSSGDISFYEDTGTTAQMTWDASADALTFTDNTKAIFGAGSDLQIYHDGSNSYVQDAGTGDLILRGSAGIKLQSGSGVLEYLSTSTTTGSVSLKLSGTTKLETTATGIDVTGTATMDGLDSSGTAYIRGASAGRINLDDSGVADSSQPFKFLSSDGGSLIFGTANRSGTSTTSSTELARFDSSGNFGIGTDSPTTPLHVYHATTDTVANFQSGDNTVAVNFTALDNSMQIATSSTDGIIKNNGAGSFRLFNNGSERARIDSSGNLHVGKTATSNTTAGTSLLEDGSFAFIVDQGDGGQEVGVINNQTSGTYVIDFRQANTDVGRIRVTASATEYQTSSDYRLKENVTYDWDAIPRLKELKPVRFNWIKDSTNTVIDGFIAHEAQEVVPESVGGDKDEVYPAGHEKAGQPNYQGIDQSKLVPLLAKAMIEQQEIIEQLQADVAELKGA
jgi:hypothetical protein